MQFNQNFWEEKYKKHQTGWDLGAVSPALKAYFDSLADPSLKILIPGAGNAYEAEYLFSLGFKQVYVVDLATAALENLKQRVPDFPENQLLHADFFEIQGQFDVIIEQTFFCALDPKFRSEYARKMHALLAPRGKLIGLLFDAKLNADHPPFGGNKAEYRTYFEPYFQDIRMDSCYNSHPARAGKELFIRMQKGD